MTNSHQDGMPTGPPRLAPRRSSYASVVSGAAPATPRSGAFSYLLHNPTGFDYDSNYYPDSNSRTGSRGGTMDSNRSPLNYNTASNPWNRSAQLPSFSAAFAPFLNGTGSNDGFFVPSYLKRSAHVQRLAEAHKAKQIAPKDGSLAQSSQTTSLSTSSSSVNLHGKIASHRGLTYDLIEKAPPLEDEALAPLPTRWNNMDRHGPLEVMSDGLEVKLNGVKAPERDNEACSIRADHPMPPQCGIYYFEVTILSRKREESTIGIGFSTKSVHLSRIPGWEPESWAYHGDDGLTFGAQQNGKAYGPPFGAGDVIGCGINFRTGSAFFTKNGNHLGTAFRDVKGKLFPSVGMKKMGEHVRVNFGQTPFVYDIDGVMLDQKNLVRREIEATDTEKICGGLSETDMIQKLVLQFLTHEGYVETARAFADEVYSERKALTIDPNESVAGFDVKEDEDARHRQKIRAAILEGEIEKALKYTNVYYPDVLKENEHIYFQLRCRKFIEMIRQSAEINRSINKQNGKAKAQNNGDESLDSSRMELDDDQNDAAERHPDAMDTEDSTAGSQERYQNLLQETIEYGRTLQAEFNDDPRKEIRKSLDEAFALFAYEDPMSAKAVAHLLHRDGRVLVAEELNSAILVSLGKSPQSALERIYAQTRCIVEDLSREGGPAALIDIDRDYVAPPRNPYSLT